MILELRNVDKKTVSKSGVINYVEYLNLKYGGKKMYNTHALEISEHALKTPEGLTSVIRFTLCTIQQSLYSCENQIADIEKHGFKSRFLKNKIKSKGLKYAMDNQVKLFWAVQELKKQNNILIMSLFCLPMATVLVTLIFKKHWIFISNMVNYLL